MKPAIEAQNAEIKDTLDKALVEICGKPVLITVAISAMAWTKVFAFPDSSWALSHRLNPSLRNISLKGKLIS